MTATRAGVRSVLSGLALAVSFAAGCGAVQSQALLATLPTSAGGVNFDSSRVIDDSFLSGLSVDDVLAALGKRRSDATFVDRFSGVGGGGIGVFVVNGVPGDVLLDTVAQTWDAPAVISRALTTIGGRDVWALEMRGGYFLLAYQRGPAV